MRWLKSLGLENAEVARLVQAAPDLLALPPVVSAVRPRRPHCLCMAAPMSAGWQGSGYFHAAWMRPLLRQRPACAVNPPHPACIPGALKNLPPSLLWLRAPTRPPSQPVFEERMQLLGLPPAALHSFVMQRPDAVPLLLKSRLNGDDIRELRRWGGAGQWHELCVGMCCQSTGPPFDYTEVRY